MRSKRLLIVAYKAYKRGELNIAKDIFAQAMGDASSPGLMEELYKSDNNMRDDDVTIPGENGNPKGDMNLLEKTQDDFGMGEEPDEKGKPSVVEPNLTEQDLELAEMEEDEDEDDMDSLEEDEPIEDDPVLSTAASKKLIGIANRIASEDGGAHRDIAKKLTRTVKAYRAQISKKSTTQKKVRRKR